jgi:hypothetical protein
LPDPPENPEFETLPESFQETVASRFAYGTVRTAQLNRDAHRAWQEQVRVMNERRHRHERARLDAHNAAVKARRANRATIGEIAAAKGKA